MSEKVSAIFMRLIGPGYVHIPKYIAYLGMTVTVKDLIEKTEDVQVHVARMDKNVFNFMKQDPEKLAAELDMPLAELYQWLAAFTFAYLIVENFDALLAMGQNVLGAVRLLAGL